MNKSILICLFAICTSFGENFIKFSDIHDTLDLTIQKYLELNKFNKAIYFYDNKFKKDGKWELYPFVRLSDSLYVVSVSTIPNIKSYSYVLVVLKSNTITILDTLGPFYDSYPGAVAINEDKNGIIKLILKVINPPEPTEEPFSLIKYKKVKGKFINTKK